MNGRSPKRESIRLPHYDYAQPGMYFVTINTQDHIHRFGRVVGADPCVCPTNQYNDQCMHPYVKLNQIGKTIKQFWQKIPTHFTNTALDEFIIMPNHFHGIIEICHSRGGSKSGQTHGSAPTSIPKIMQWFKTKTTNEYIRCVHAGMADPFEKRFWQRNYYERIIRDDDELNRIREYIQNNPAKWTEDELNR